MLIFIQILLNIASNEHEAQRHYQSRGGFIMSCRKNEMNLGIGIG